jgi:hypothetical protein
MQQLLVYFWRMCLLRTSPENAPVAGSFIAFVLLAYLLSSTSLLFIAGSGGRVLQTISVVVLGIIVQLTCTWLVLAFKNFTQRFRATIASLLGTNTILVVFLIPLNFLLMATDQQLVIIIVEFLYWVFFFWWIAIAGYILHKATNISLLQGSTLAFTIEIISILVTSVLLPAQAVN